MTQSIAWAMLVPIVPSSLSDPFSVSLIHFGMTTFQGGLPLSSPSCMSLWDRLKLRPKLMFFYQKRLWWFLSIYCRNSSMVQTSSYCISFDSTILQLKSFQICHMPFCCCDLDCVLTARDIHPPRLLSSIHYKVTVQVTQLCRALTFLTPWTI